MPLLTKSPLRGADDFRTVESGREVQLRKMQHVAAHHIFSISWSPGPFAHGVQPLHSRCANSLFRIFNPTG